MFYIMNKWKEILRRLFLAGNNDEETSGSQRFKDTVAEANANPEQATKIYLDAAKDRAKETAAAVAIPLGGGAAGPIVADLATGAFIADGLYNLASENGVQKTYNHIKNGEWSDAARSAGGDLLNLAMIYPGLKLVKNITKGYVKNIPTTSNINGYEKPIIKRLQISLEEPVMNTYYHGSPKINITDFIPGRDGGIYWTPDIKAAKGYTGLFSTGKVYKAKLNLGQKPITIDLKNRFWNNIPEEDISNAFNLSKEDILKQIGHYNSGANPWYTDFLVPFGYKPKAHSYAIDQIVKLGKNQGYSSIIFKNAKDTGKSLIAGFSKPKIYDQVVVYDPSQIHLYKYGAKFYRLIK